MTRALERMPLYFIENRGQLDPRVAYYVQGRDTTLYFTAEGMTLAQTKQRPGENGVKGGLEKVSLGRGVPQRPDPASRWIVKLDFVGANPHPKNTASDRLPAVVSYFKGPKENWKAGLSTYVSIVYSDLWPGIDLVYSGTANRLKYSFLVKPGADPAQVRLAYRGVKGVKLNEAGQLEVETPAGVLQDDKPYAYQEGEGHRVEDTLVSTVFHTSDCGCDFSSLTFIQALSLSSGNTLCEAQGKLFQMGVSALLNACNSGIAFPESTAKIIADVNAALDSCDRTQILSEATQLDTFNNGPGGCPLGGPATVNVTADSTTAAFDNSVVAVARSSKGKISAAAGGSTKTATLRVTP